MEGSECVLLKTGDVTITDAFARFGDASYPVSEIRSVRVKIRYLVNPLTILFALSAVAALLRSLLAGAVMALVTLGFMAYFRTRVARLVLGTSNGNNRVFQSKDVDLVDEIAVAIESAIKMKDQN